MKSNKGISMLTLVITIICIIIFLGIAYRVGTRYISESKQKERVALVSVLSDAVVRRQNDKYVGFSGSGEVVYSGYHIKSGEFVDLAKNFENNSYMYEPGLWFVIDSNSAEDLGLVETDEYLVEDLTKKPEDEENKYVAVVDYYTGQVELVKYEEIKITVDDAVEGDGGHVHTYSIATCIFPAVCTGCGHIKANTPLGHAYKPDRIICTEDKVCTRCGYIAEKAIGHEYDMSTLSFDDRGHFNKCVRYDTCGAVGNFEEHTLQYAKTPDPDEWLHTVDCTVCDWQKAMEECTIEIRPKDIYYHVKYCTKCFNEDEVEHDAIKKYKYIDEDEHMVYCETCSSDLYREEHIDVETPYGICDKCNGIIDIDEPPIVKKLTMENATDGALEKYWAKRGEKIKITLETSMILAGAPTIKLQDTVISTSNMYQEDDDPLTWFAEIDTADYIFNEGLINIEVTDIKSLWNVAADNMYETTDSNYIRYDATKPVYIFIPEE